jgi:hypothetical protein
MDSEDVATSEVRGRTGQLVDLDRADVASVAPNIQPSCTIVVTVSSGMPVSFFFYICDGGLSADSVRCLQHAPEIVADVVLLKLRCELLHGREGFVRPLPARRVDFGP